MRRPGRSWPPRRHRCPRRPAASGTGTTATRGSAIPRSCCGRCTRLGFEWEAYEYFAFLIETRSLRKRALQIMYGHRRVSGTSPSARSTICPATRRPAGAGRQRRLRPAPARCLGDAPRLGLHPRPAPGTQIGPAGSGTGSAQLVDAADRALAASRTAASGRSAGEPQHFTASKVMCWVAADRGAQLAAARGDAERADRWRKAADEIHADDLRQRASTSRGVFVQHYGTDRRSTLRRC